MVNTSRRMFRIFNPHQLTYNLLNKSMPVASASSSKSYLLSDILFCVSLINCTKSNVSALDSHPHVCITLPPCDMRMTICIGMIALEKLVNLKSHQNVNPSSEVNDWSPLEVNVNLFNFAKICEWFSIEVFMSVCVYSFGVFCSPHQYRNVPIYYTIRQRTFTSTHYTGIQNVAQTTFKHLHLQGKPNIASGRHRNDNAIVRRKHNMCQ
jgi:hypothetical protein